MRIEGKIDGWILVGRDRNYNIDDMFFLLLTKHLSYFNNQKGYKDLL